MKRSLKCIQILALGGLLGGCATAGSLMEMGGNVMGMSGQFGDAGKSIAAAGTSFKRSAEVNEFSDEEKYYTGRSVAANLLAGSTLSDDLALEQYVGKVGQTVGLASGKSGLTDGWHFILIKGDDADAFAAPGGIILLTEGLVKDCQSEDELAGVLAHEVSHISIGHPMQAISASNKKNAIASLLQAGAQVATKDQQGSQALATQFGNVVKDVAKGVTQGYDRSKEKEADLEAVRLLVDLGYDPRGLARVLRRMRSSDHSHGDPAERAKLVDQAAYEAEPVPKQLDVRTARFKKALGL